MKEMSAMSMQKLAANMNKAPFTLATDSSNDGDRKQFPLVIRTFDVGTDGSLGTVRTQLLAVKDCEGSASGENIFNLIDMELQAQGVTWDNCIAFGSDNAAVMIGQHKGVFSFIKKKNPEVYMAACTLHLVHIAAKKGASCLPPVEETIIDIFYFLKKSTLRQEKLKRFQELFDVEQQKMLKHGCTRWLSIGRCINRLLQNWDPLRTLMKEELKMKKEADEKKQKKEAGSRDTDREDGEHFVGTSTSKLESINRFLQSPTNRLFTLFLAYTLKVFDVVLVNLQAEEPLIHTLRPSLLSLIMSIFSRFVKPSVVLNHDITEVKYQLRENQKEDNDLLIGDLARNFIVDAEKNNLKSTKLAEFYTSVRQYFEATCSYLLQKLPLSDPLLKHSVVLDTASQTQSSVTDLRYFLARFPCLVPPEVSVEMLEEQFAKYQISDIKDCICDSPKVDDQWIKISTKHKDLQQLARVMLGIMTIPHSSAACERVFSCVRKNSTSQRASLGSDTLEAILVLKTTPQQDFSNEDLDKLKSAYSLHQQQYKV